MVESVTIVTLCLLYLIFFRPGKTPPLENPLVIERPGEYHMKLAPQLNLAQPFIETLAKQIGPSAEAGLSSETKFFEVRDQQVKSHGFNFYLLAITLRNGMLYFQAARPLSKEASEQVKTISDYSNEVLANVPDSAEHVSCDHIVAAIQAVAQQRNMQIKAI
ncbi:MAG: hypothetical protein R8K48_00620 [Gallionella sp.]